MAGKYKYLHTLRKCLFGNEGSISVVVALSLVILVGSVALVTDAGLLYINRERMVNALDSAVLAGVKELPVNPAEALDTAYGYGVANGLSSEESSFEIGNENCSVAGSASREVGLFFARALGINERSITVQSKARIAPVSSVKGVVPFGVLERDFTFGQQVTLKVGPDDNVYSGWYGVLSLGGTGSSNYEHNVKYGYNGEISIGDIIAIESGNMSGPTRDGIEYRLQECRHIPHCTIDSFVDGCLRILIVPIINIEEINDGGHPSKVKVAGFGAFLVDSCSGNGAESIINGSFVRYVISGKSDGSISDYGLYRAVLCE
ncbi:MAG: Tad domain-containing protein [Syntrophomonas sp.]